MRKFEQVIFVVLLLFALASAMIWGGKNRGENPGKAGEETERQKELGDGGEKNRRGETTAEQKWQGEDAPCIVIDAGHGGYDPGKMGINQVPEKEVNLIIAKLLKEELEALGVRVVMTREEDCALCGEGETQAKVRDLKKRIRIIEEAKPAAAVSIHQNSYQEESIRGAQVFYYETSTEGKKLAQSLQKHLIEDLDPENDRAVKDNNSYYLLKKTSVPIVIAECGFLSNWEEAEKLCSKEYQKAVARALCSGIVDYLEKK